MRQRPSSIKIRALQWLAQREHSRDELRRKLLHLLTGRAADAGAAGGMDAADAVDAIDAADSAAGSSTEALSARGPDEAQPAAAEVEALLDWLEQRGYLSRQRFVESRVHAREARFGNLRIRRELQQHGLTVDDKTEQTLRATEFERAREVWRKKYGQIAGDASQRVRQMRFLTGRGFSPDVVRRVVRDPGEEFRDESRDAARGEPGDEARWQIGDENSDENRD